mmetsp:Transcript_32378/g.44477  ORF Transcript_32378/g.44477 Transcript_32378/m.44477 type:complete len:228 (+) Transcript_32378:243-926(+)|eukprot:CAMPEP_0201489904 /NCGR_PEP_ID=MMETSP0151_2-20130828/24129_1 /ASSEMBLY_ACC=CAM_ASM_000257 /TAXON_ID=200890 /ORGANISM="Paramoeba atlantica, Strain 621/1 / CCAP 1560/9" /LENGTH=227 /DNA_ID=CAMNT_0047875643 /DNA_START=222 /DNA_END=905 /DNA_ORIENTATION=+
MASSSSPLENSSYRVVCFIFDEFELLDAFGPLEMFSVVQRVSQTTKVTIEMVGFSQTIKATGGPKVVVDQLLMDDLPKLLSTPIDLLLIPGGMGTQKGLEHEPTLEALRQLCNSENGAKKVMSVCTGSAFLAKAGLLEGRKATSNKLVFEWVKSTGPQVEWVEEARWVVDDKFITSSGVAAGIDAALAVIEMDFDFEMSQEAAMKAEYVPNRDPSSDPFYQPKKNKL